MSVSSQICQNCDGEGYIETIHDRYDPSGQGHVCSERREECPDCEGYGRVEVFEEGSDYADSPRE
jgi:RecJ-like exonuclease